MNNNETVTSQINKKSITLKSPRKTKILYCITKSNMGGAQKYVYDLAISLPKDTFDVSVLVGNDGTLVQKLQTANIRTIVLGNLNRNIKFWSDLKSFFKLIKIFRQERPDIIHLNSSKIGLLGALAGRLTNITKIIFTGHGWAFNEDRSPFQKKILYYLHKFTICLSHKTIAVSEQTKNQIIKSNCDNKKIIVIKNGLEQIDFFDKETARKFLAEKLPSNLNLENRFWLGTISELHKNKGLKYLIEAIHLLDIACEDQSSLPLLIIIGGGERREKLQQRINRYNLNNVIFLLGRIEEANKYLKAFDIFTLTSITEALPYALLEAGQAGLPIIASGVGGIPEIIDDMQNGILVRPKEPTEIKQALDFILTKPDKIALFSTNIRNKILTEFSREKMIAETLPLYTIKWYD